MKYLLFNKVPYEYGADFDVAMVGSKERGFGAYEEKDAKILIKLHGDLISELEPESYDELKKKAELGPGIVSSIRNATTGGRQKSQCSVCKKGKSQQKIA